MTVGAPETRFGDRHLPVTDVHGFQLTLVESARPPRRLFTPWDHSPVPTEHQIRGLYGARLWEQNAERTSLFLTRVLGLLPAGTRDGWARYGSGSIAGFVDIRQTPEEQRGAWGVGTVHHLAWRVRDDDEQLAMRDQLEKSRQPPHAGHRSLLVQVGVLPRTGRRAVRDRDRRPRLREGRRARASRRTADAPAVARTSSAARSKTRCPRSRCPRRRVAWHSLGFEHVYRPGPTRPRRRCSCCTAPAAPSTISCRSARRSRRHPACSVRAARCSKARCRASSGACPKACSISTTCAPHRASWPASFATRRRTTSSTRRASSRWGSQTARTSPASVLLLEARGRSLAGAILFRAMVPIVPDPLPDLSGVRILMSNGRTDSLIPAAQAEQLAGCSRTAARTDARMAAGRPQTDESGCGARPSVDGPRDYRPGTKAGGRRRKAPRAPADRDLLRHLFVAMSMTDTSFDGPFAVKSVVPSGDSAMPHGRWPASTDPDHFVRRRVERVAPSCCGRSTRRGACRPAPSPCPSAACRRRA